ncbi:MAG TPA: YcnI family protein [Acidimicrobiales bacterium]|nr:YcnI family protein [Acidimicrobiales bacterium]
MTRTAAAPADAAPAAPAGTLSPSQPGDTRRSAGTPPPGHADATRRSAGTPPPGQPGDTRRSAGTPPPGQPGATRRSTGAPLLHAGAPPLHARAAGAAPAAAVPPRPAGTQRRSRNGPDRRSALAAAMAAVVLALAVVAAPAAAHVTVNPGEAAKGGFAKLAFRVPNERPDSGTVKLELTFPPEHPLSSVSVRPQPGWAFTTEKTNLERPVEREGAEAVTEAVSKITWTGGPVNPGEFQEFEVSVGPLPENADQLVFKAVQTYASGEVVRWIDEAAPGGEEPEHPAPVLALTAGDAGAQTAPAAVEDSSSKEADDTERLALIALAVGVLGLLAGVASLSRRHLPAPNAEQ